MFIQLVEAREDRLKRARMALASVTDYPIRVAQLKTQPLTEPTWPRGVYEVEIAARGYRTFNIVYSNGDISFHQFPAHRVTRDLVRGMNRKLDRDDPVSLHIVKPAETSASFLPFPRGRDRLR